MPKVGLFISWSGNSRGVAEALYEWLPTALHSIDPWMSDYDIHLGTRFLEEIDTALVRCKAGLICLTPENSQSVWVAFESGALASRVASSKLVIPLISRMRPSEVSGPLGVFQACQLNRSDMLRLIRNLNDLNVEEDKIPEKQLTATFDGVWPNLRSLLPEIESAQVEAGETETVRKSDTQLLEEILDVSKSVRILIEDRFRGVSALGESIEGKLSETTRQTPMSSGSGLEGREGYTALSKHLLRASEIWLEGISLISVVNQYYESFCEYIEHGKIALRFLLLDSADNTLIDTAIRSLYGVSAPNDLRQDIHDVAEKVLHLRDIAYDSRRVQLRYMTSLPSTSIIMADPTGGKGTAIAEFYPYRASSNDRPHIFLSQANRAEEKWFFFYRDQFLTMWRDARIVE